MCVFVCILDKLVRNKNDRNFFFRQLAGNLNYVRGLERSIDVEVCDCSNKLWLKFVSSALVLQIKITQGPFTLSNR
jgi:hypothetical protein